MRYSFFLAFLGLIALSACQPTADVTNDRVTPSGFKYTVFPSNSNIVAEEGQFIYYQIKAILNGELQQDSRDAPTTPFVRMTAPLPDSIPQPQPNILLEVMRDLEQGDSAVVIVPAADAPFFRGLTPADTITYDLVIREILNAEDFQTKREQETAALQAKIEKTQVEAQLIDSTMVQIIEDYKAGSLDGQLQTTDEGLKYLVIEKGEGQAISKNDFVSVHYFGKLTDGSTFDNSYKNGTPFTFPIGQGRVIKGWDQGIPMFNQGGKGYLFIPSELGYGANAAGSIPPNSELVFYVSVENVKVNTFAKKAQ